MEQIFVQSCYIKFTEIIRKHRRKVQLSSERFDRISVTTRVTRYRINKSWSSMHKHRGHHHRISKRLNKLIYKYRGRYSLEAVWYTRWKDERFALLGKSNNKAKWIAEGSRCQRDKHRFRRSTAYVRKLEWRARIKIQCDDRLAGNVGLPAIIYFVFHSPLLWM